MELVSTLDNPLPEGATLATVTTSDGVRLRAMVARKPKSRGTVVFLGGRADFMERYFETMKDMMAKEEKLHDSLIKNIYTQGQVMKRKYRLIKIAYTIFMVGFPVAIVCYFGALYWG